MFLDGVCKYFLKGTCHRGNQCQFKHTRFVFVWLIKYQKFLYNFVFVILFSPDKIALICIPVVCASPQRQPGSCLNSKILSNYFSLSRFVLYLLAAPIFSGVKIKSESILFADSSMQIFILSEAKRQWCASTGCAGCARKATCASFCTSTISRACLCASSSRNMVKPHPSSSFNCNIVTHVHTHTFSRMPIHKKQMQARMYTSIHILCRHTPHKQHYNSFKR